MWKAYLTSRLRLLVLILRPSLSMRNVLASIGLVDDVSILDGTWVAVALAGALFVVLVRHLCGCRLKSFAYDDIKS